MFLTRCPMHVIHLIIFQDFSISLLNLHPKCCQNSHVSQRSLHISRPGKRQKKGGKHKNLKGRFQCKFNSPQRVCRLLAYVVLASSDLSECSRVPQLSDDHYCRTLLHSAIDSQGFPTTWRLLLRWRGLFIFSDKSGVSD